MQAVVSLKEAVFIAMVVATACAPLTSPPERRADGDYACSNPLVPEGRFAIVFSRDGVREDTTPAAPNRYLLPRQSRDTVRITLNDGRKSLAIWRSPSPNYCVTYAESLWRRLPDPRSWFPVP